MQMNAVIEAVNLSIEYKLGSEWVNALRDVSLAIHPLEIHGLVGESGSGKSTLALALMRYMASNARISGGRILFEGEDITAATPDAMRALWGSKMALVPQDPLAALNPSYTVGEQIAEITRQHAGLNRRESLARAVEMLRRVKIADPETVVKRYPHQLSGGMQQRAVIAMALSTQPHLLVLDEPTTALDVTTEAVILDLVRELVQEEGAAALWVTHDLGVVAQVCERMTVLYGGEVMSSGDVRRVFTRQLHPYTISLLASLPRATPGVETRLPTIEGVAPSLVERPPACVFSDRCPAAVQLCRDVKPPLERTGDGRLVRCHRWHEIENGSLRWQTQPQEVATSAPPHDNLVLQGDDVYKFFGEAGPLDRLLRRERKPVRAVDGVSLSIRERSTLGLVGESGSGKTTLARLIVGLETADDGALQLLDVPLSRRLEQRSIEQMRNLQMVFQNPNDALNPFMTIGEALARTIRRLSAERLDEAAVNARVSALLQAVRLTEEYAYRYPTELSGGEKQRIAIARAFAANPALVVADEPTSSLDVSVQSVILNLLKDLRAQQGASYLFISHDLKVIAYLADWILVMYLGEVIEEGSVEQVYNGPSHPYTEALISAIPEPDPKASRKHIRLEGDVPSARNIPTGCRFHTRCPRKIGAICETDAPPWRDAGDGHFIRCHIPVEELRELQQSAGELLS
ncbi:MAG: ABC transporter ATP-binding protein [Anaerolineae bacterium]|nr:ABC transporter ATP-binding protein [Anaerolineae bacterium]